MNNTYNVGERQHVHVGERVSFEFQTKVTNMLIEQKQTGRTHHPLEAVHTQLLALEPPTSFDVGHQRLP